jgi:vacuolar-type H+-ATPase subunit H
MRPLASVYNTKPRILQSPLFKGNNSMNEEIAKALARIDEASKAHQKMIHEASKPFNEVLARIDEASKARQKMIHEASKPLTKIQKIIVEAASKPQGMMIPDRTEYITRSVEEGLWTWKAYVMFLRYDANRRQN